MNDLEQLNETYYRVIYAFIHNLVDDYIRDDVLTEKTISNTLISMLHMQPSDVKDIKPIIRDYLNDN